jgi:NTP pyrophosphatase (non-canonical NTP hydrolase)
MPESLGRLTELVLKFRSERDWGQFHTPKELAISLVVEAGELLEIMQWKQGRDLARTVKKKRGEIADELADCLHSVLLLAHDMKIDLGAALVEKLRKSAIKYPIHKAKGRAEKYTELKTGSSTKKH